jgi:Rod binding domain-containing protein
MGLAASITAAAAAGAKAASGAPEPRLVRAAHEFEAQMMKELLKPMTESSSLTGEDDAQGSGGALGEFASEALGRALSEQGGFGIASSIVKDLSSPGNRRASGNRGTVPGVT